MTRTHTPRRHERGRLAHDPGRRVIGFLPHSRLFAFRDAVRACPLLFLLLAGGCGGPPGERAPAGDAHTPAPLYIAAASDLTLALPRLIERFEAETQLKATPVMGVSGQLASQIKEGAPYDVFMAADQAYVADLARTGAVVESSVKPYARGSLVLVVRPQIADRVRSLADLTGPAVGRIALANPTFAPYGRAGKQALERAGLWTKLEPRIVLGESVRQALVYVERGDADVGLVGRAIAQSPAFRVVEIDDRLYDPLIQAIGVVAASKRTADAASFVAFVMSDPGQAILKEFGFAPGSPER